MLPLLRRLDRQYLRPQRSTQLVGLGVPVCPVRNLRHHVHRAAWCARVLADGDGVVVNNREMMTQPPDLPPGQVLTQRFPVVGEQRPAPGLPLGAIAGQGRSGEPEWSIQITGQLRQARMLALSELLALPQQQRRIDIHCVTGWSRQGVEITGLPLATVWSTFIDGLGVRPDVAYLRFVAHSPRAHDTSLPLDYALAETWLVYAIDGQALTSEHGGPLRTVTPGRYFYKSLKWLAGIELLTEECLGYWERESAYHNHADPLLEERFDEASTADPQSVLELRAATDLAPFRGRLWIKARFGGWAPKTRDLSGLQCKCCSFRNALLVDCDFTGTNLSLSSFEGAELRGSYFGNCDLEGVSFAGADLCGAVIERAAMSATRFFRDFSNGRRLAARVEGLRLREFSGLLDEQRDFLLANGAQVV